jgi:predicted O-methyltransferase YrrM
VPSPRDIKTNSALAFLQYYLGFLQRFLRFYRGARTVYDVHSPFVTDLIRHILEDERQFYPFAEIENLRSRLLRSPEKIRISDHGAGSKVQPTKTRKVASLARHGAIDRQTGRQLFKLVHHYEPKHILELGACLGISTLYLAKASPGSRVITLEGCPNTARLAGEHYASLDCKNITRVEGTFKDKLEETLGSLPSLDLLFLDGDHRGHATLDYVNTCLAKAGPGSIFILADIHWTGDMEKAWERIRALPQVTLSIDLFQIGLLFFDPAIREKTHYRLVRWRWKPWRIF